MLGLAFGLLCIAAAVGAGLAIRYLRGKRPRPLAAVIAIAHGVVGAASLAALTLALRRGLPPPAMGTAGFGVAAAALLGLALAFGFLLAHVSWRRRRPPGLIIATHASLAIAALMLLLALVALRQP
jgi:hypothetical protein